MRNLILAAGVAALAITAPAAAKPDKGGGGDRQEQARGGGGGQAKAQRGGGGGGRQPQMQQRGGSGGERRAMQMERRGGDRQIQRMRGGDRQVMRAERRGGDRQRIERGSERRFAIQNNRNERQAQRMERRGQERRFANFQSDRNERRAQRVENRGNRNVARVESRNRGNERFERAAREQRAERLERRGGERADRIAMDRRERIQRVERFERANVQRNRDVAPVRAFLGDDRDAFRDGRDYRRYDEWRDWSDGDWDRRYASRGIPAAYVGCPPGLAKKSPACVPPGQARQQFVGSVLPTYYASNYFPTGLRDIYYDTDDYYYRYGDGYAYRVNRSDNLVAALLPLIGAGYGVGQYFPYYNEPSYYVPSYYQSFYPNYGDDYYRYANGYVYEIDGRSGLVEDVIPLLDRGYGLGQMMPAGYSYYNVPYQYRDYYQDTDDYYYRYAPGAIYQVDRDSQLITAIAALLTGGLSVGQPLPAGYSMYNVPYAYRDRYYDSPDAWYRYSNGYIYEVDPATQLIRTMVQALV
jgi:hypothetical protein